MAESAVVCCGQGVVAPVWWVPWALAAPSAPSERCSESRMGLVPGEPSAEHRLRRQAQFLDPSDSALIAGMAGEDDPRNMDSDGVDHIALKDTQSVPLVPEPLTETAPAHTSICRSGIPTCAR